MLPAITIIGGADSGKSTLIGNLLIETKSIPQSLVQKVKDLCKGENLVFEPAYLVDYMREEIALQSTRERALAELKIGKEKILIIDTPGQMMLSKKMISGLSEANMAIILVDMTDNDIKKYRYYLKLVSLLGFSEIVIVINKLDLFNYKKKAYDQFLKKFGIKGGKNFHVVPISALKSQNLSKKPELLTWHNGDNLLKTLRKILKTNKKQEEAKILMPVQSVLEIGKEKITLGTILEGNISISDEIKVFDGEDNKKTKIKKLYHYYKEVNKVFAGENVGVVFDSSEQQIKRGYILNNFEEKYFSNKVDAGLYVLEPFVLDNLGDYTVRFLKGIYGIKKIKIKKRLSFQLIPLNNFNDKLSTNEFLDAQMVLDKKILRINSIIARRFIIENKENNIIAFGVIK